MEREALEIYTIYDHPPDYPESFVIRRFIITDGRSVPDNRFLFQSPLLETCREQMMVMALVCIARDPNDHPNIVESWL